jgi:hypothetical protein
MTHPNPAIVSSRRRVLLSAMVLAAQENLLVMRVGISTILQPRAVDDGCRA